MSDFVELNKDCVPVACFQSSSVCLRRLKNPIDFCVNERKARSKLHVPSSEIPREG